MVEEVDKAAKPAKPSLFKRIGNLITDTNGNMRWQAALMCITVLVVVIGIVGSNVGEVVSIRQSLLHNHPSGITQGTKQVRNSLSGSDVLRAHWDDVKGTGLLSQCSSIAVSFVLTISILW
jgi:hypothetical protein